MLERDFIMKQVNQLIAVLSRVLEIVFRMQKQDDIEVSFTEINEILDKHLSLSIDTLLSINEEELIETLMEEHHMTFELIGQIGDLLFETSKITSEIPYSRETLRRRALYLYEYVESHDETYSLDRHFRKEEIINILSENEASAD